MASIGWPKLSETLPRDYELEVIFPLEWGQCQKCGRSGELFDELEVWLEHDEKDKATPVAVVLCPPCAKKIIEPHPRLYALQRKHAPIPGVMELCAACVHREGYRCRHEDLTVNGGPGLEIYYPEPMQAHVTYGRKRGGRRGEWLMMWKGPATSCVGQE